MHLCFHFFSCNIAMGELLCPLFHINEREHAITLPSSVSVAAGHLQYACLVDVYVFPFFIIVPVQDDGNMPDIPAHPCDKEGEQLEWLKK
ncbi:NADH dehydrogenase [Crotalus adamanteus]|uniref:NADH dehydrogenase n=1 Tax=Crotalus adamanteus TaxID=8729 RepID=A0AAW1B0K4_CROAD